METGDKNGGPNNLRAWREYRHMSRDALAEAVNTQPNMILYLESGQRTLSAKWLRRLAPVLKINPGWLLDHDPRSLPPDIIDIWSSATERQRRQIAEIAATIVRDGTRG